jgi:hypothetical protein
MLRRRHIVAGLGAATASFALYLAAVVLATPTFETGYVVAVALERNGLVVAAVSVGVGALAALILANRDAGCAVDDAGAAGAGGGAFGVFASMFALTSVGCCGVFVFWMTILFGAGAAGFLSAHSMTLTLLGLAVMAGSIAVLARRVRRRKAGGPDRG